MECKKPVIKKYSQYLADARQKKWHIHIPTSNNASKNNALLPEW